ncbi:MAG: LLM class flavin-dependent oxidoreductase [Actinomycetota bacterium]|nr:LLM class flavin-dependent oxidoreductase [Actinomycetota bacterium]
MKIGITLPQFRHDAEPAIGVAREAEAAGLDGVFVFDHLWRIAQPEGPALHGSTLLAALAVETGRVVVGSLVARIGLVPDAVLVHSFATLNRMAPGRLVAGLGVGDVISKSENLAYGVPFPPAAERRASLSGCCRRLRALGITTWVGGLSTATRAVGWAEADAVNLWAVDPTAVAAEVESAAPVAVSWGGRLDVGRGGAAAPTLRSLAAAGATWAVVAPVGVSWEAAVDATARAAQGLP